MMNPTNFDGEAVCPICAGRFEADDPGVWWRGYMLHPECGEDMGDDDDREHVAA